MFVVGVYCFLFCVYSALPECLGEEHLYLLRTSSIGFPTVEYRKEAWNINELMEFNGRLYIGYGDATVNTGPTDVIYYDCEKDVYVKEFTVEEEGIYTYGLIDGRLAIPGVDATESWELGNMYVLEDTGWVKRRSITHGIHVFDLASFDGKWYAATGSYFDFGEEDMGAFGVILSSDDEGASWRFEYSTPCDKNTVFRVRSLAVCGGKLYAFPYAYGSVTEAEVPPEYRNYLGEPYVEGGEEYYTIFLDEPMGAADAVVYDGAAWEPVDLVREPHVCLVTPAVFKDKLILSVVQGEYVAPFSEYVSRERETPPYLSTSLFTFDGTLTKPLPLDYELIRDIVVKEDVLLLLFLRDTQYLIAQTRDLETWQYYALPYALEEPLSLEYVKESFMIGMKDGNIFKSVGYTPIGDLLEAKGRQPFKFHGAAELPRDGKRYWAAITGWQNWGRLARFSCELKSSNVIEVTTENVATLSLFVPSMEIDRTEPLLLVIDGQEAFRDTMGGSTELRCGQIGGEWVIEKGHGTAGKFRYARKIVGRSAIELKNTGDQPLIGFWKADVLRRAVSADIAIVVRSEMLGDLPEGDVSLEDIFRISPGDSVCLFTMSGAALREMLDFNVKLSKEERCQGSGFDLKYEEHENSGDNRIVYCSLNSEAEYVVAVSDYLALRAKRFLGQEVDCQNGGIRVTDAMMEWFSEFGTIERVQATVRAIAAE